MSLHNNTRSAILTRFSDRQHIATVQKILTEILPSTSGVTTSKDFRDVLVDCCVEFITLVSSEANEISEKESKKTIACEHVTAALKELGFDEYVDAVQDSADEFKRAQAVRVPSRQDFVVSPRLTLRSSRGRGSRANSSRVAFLRRN